MCLQKTGSPSAYFYSNSLFSARDCNCHYSIYKGSVLVNNFSIRYLSSLIPCVIGDPDHRIIRAVTKKCKFNSSGRNCTLTKQMSTAIFQTHLTTYKMTGGGKWKLAVHHLIFFISPSL